MAKALTAAAVAKLVPDASKRVEIGDGMCPGLRLAITPSGAKSFVCRYKLHGKAGKLTLGSVEHLSLAAARQAARAAMAKVAVGEDPAAEKRQAKAAAKTRHRTVDDLVETQVEAFIQRHVSRLKSGAEMSRILRRELRAWHGRRVQEITRRDVVELVDSIADRGAPTMANRTLAHTSKFFAWLVARDIVPASPVQGVEKATAEVPRDRVLRDAELKRVLAAAEKLKHPFAGIVRLLALTGARRDEVAGMRWSELHDLDGTRPEWRLPSSRTKNARPHVVFLAPTAAQLLAGLPRIESSDYVFTTTGETTVSGWSRMRTRLDKLVEASLVDGETMPARWVLHDLRRTCSTGMSELGVAPHVVEVALNHVSGSRAGVAGTYNRSRHADLVRDAFERWASHVDAL